MRPKGGGALDLGWQVNTQAFHLRKIYVLKLRYVMPLDLEYEYSRGKKKKIQVLN